MTANRRNSRKLTDVKFVQWHYKQSKCYIYKTVSGQYTILQHYVVRHTYLVKWRIIQHQTYTKVFLHLSLFHVFVLLFR